MKGEISGLKSGIYMSDDGSLICKICKTDYGNHIEFADLDGNVFYAVCIDEKNSATFEVGDIVEELHDEMRKDENE